MGDTTRPSAFRSAAPHPSKRFAIVGGYDQVIAPVGKVDARFSHVGNYTTNKIYCGDLLWQSNLTLPHPSIPRTSASMFPRRSSTSTIPLRRPQPASRTRRKAFARRHGRPRPSSAASPREGRPEIETGFHKYAWHTCGLRLVPGRGKNTEAYSRKRSRNSAWPTSAHCAGRQSAST